MKYGKTLLSLLASAAVALGISSAQAQQDGIKWAAGGQGSINAEAALATSQVLRLAGLPVYAVNSAGTVDGLLTLARGELDLINADNRSLKQAWNGEGGFQKVRGYSQVMSGFSTFFFIFVPENSPIRTVKDLAGKTLNGHVPGAAINFWVRDYIAALESTGAVAAKSVKQSQIALTQVFDAMQDGRIDAQAGYVFADKLPTWIEQGMARNFKLRVIEMPMDTLAPMAAKDWHVVSAYPSAEIARVDAAAGKQPRIPTSGLTTVIVARDSLPKDRVTGFLTTFFANLDKVQGAHIANKMYADGPSTGIQYLLKDVPVHPAAADFYRRNNAWRSDLTVSTAN